MSFTIVFENGVTVPNLKDFKDAVAKAVSLETEDCFKWSLFQSGNQEPVYHWFCVAKY